MLTLPAGFKDAASKSGHEPRFLLELPALGVYLSTHDGDFGHPNALDEGLTVGGGWLLDGNRPAYDPRIALNGVGTIRLGLDDKGRPGRVGEVTMLINNADRYAGQFFNQRLDTTAARVLMGWRDLPFTDYVLVLTAVVDNDEITDKLWRLTLTIDSLRANVSLSTPVGERFYPGAPIANRGRNIPIAVGRQTNIETIQVRGDADGTLAFAFADGDTELFLTELDAPFPPSGSFVIGSDAGFTYTRRDNIRIEGIEYLRLSGLNDPPGNDNNPVGTLVVLTNTPPQYLVAYEVGGVTEVRDDDGIVDPVDYTILSGDLGADRPTTLIEFSIDPTGVVFADADGINVDLDAQVTNGSFETGTLADWTVEAGGVGAVGTPGAIHGDFYAALTGVVGGNRRLQQTIPTKPNRFYELEFYYRDTVPGTELFLQQESVGGGPGWVFVQTTEADAVSTLNRFDEFGVEFQVPFRYVSHSKSFGIYQFFRFTMFQDITTIIGEGYQLAVTGQIQFISWGGSSGTFSGNANTPLSHLDKLLYQVGSPGAPDDVDSGEFLDDASGNVLTSNRVNFVATSVTTRITITMESVSLSGVALVTLPGPLSLKQTSIIRTSHTRLEIGSAAVADEIFGQDLPLSYAFQRRSTSFKATSSQTVLSLTSQWEGDIATPSHFDDVKLVDTGRNPADAIAYIIDNFTGLTRNQESFDIAFGKLTGYQFGALISDPDNSEQLLERMAFQCGSRLLRLADGSVALRVVDYRSLPVAEFNESNILDPELGGNGFRAKRETIDNVYTKFTVWYGQRTGEGTDRQGFQGQIYADGISTSHPTAPLSTFCAGARDLYGGEHEFEYTAEMHRDIDSAHLFLTWLVYNRTLRHFDLSFRTPHEFGVALEEGDLVSVEHGLFATGLPYICEVISKTISDADIALVCRTVRLAGFFEPWNDNSEYTPISELFEPWDS